jgi:hypothetical protein
VKPAGLICAGGVGRSFLSRMPSVLASIGPVKAGSLRVARRMANTLRAGHAVEHYEALRDCRLIWICVPEEALDGILPNVSNKMIAICDSARDADALRTGSARVATVNVVEPDERVFAAEGHADVMREIRRTAVRERRKLIELAPGSKALFLAGMNLAGYLMLPGFAAAVESLRAAGFGRAEAASVAESAGVRALRAYAKGGRKSWSPKASGELRRAVARDLDGLGSREPKIAGLYAASIDQALKFFEG